MLCKRRIYLQSFLSITVLFFSLALPKSPTFAQKSCATVIYNQNRKLLNTNIETEEQFEGWIKDKITLKKQMRAMPFSTYALKEAVLRIPVVVHIIHDGEEIGTGANIPDAQIISQINVLNEDFRRLNADADQTPVEFLPVAADTEIEFVLAKRDPEGLPTTGIVRVNGNKSGWIISEDLELKALSYWPAEDYMNIWVANLLGGFLGFSQFPVSNLEGLEDVSDNRLTDGLVIGHQYFGSAEKDPNAFLEAPWNLGRTTTHEVGHFLGLRHVWGDGGCSVDDFVDDTPNQSKETLGCVTSKSSCGSPDMFQNYMDYTDDECMNILTLGQKERMRVVLASSPRRASLTTSPALNDPVAAAFDLGIKEIIEPVNSICTPNVTPTLQLRNYGVERINKVTIQLSIDGNLIETKTEVLSLDTLEVYTMAFNPVATSIAGPVDYEFKILSVNDTIDENPQNNIAVHNVFVSEFLELPSFENFDGPPPGWEIQDPDVGFTWELTQCPSWTADNNGIFLAFRNNTKIGEEDSFVLPVVNLGGMTNAYLHFDMSYAYTEGSDWDGLRIGISTDCGISFDQIIYDRSGSALATTENTGLSFIPARRLDWQHKVINLSSFQGIENLKISFIGTNGNGNNIYLDNISIQTEKTYDLGVKGIRSPYLAFCADSVIPVITIENLGSEEINDLEIDFDLNGLTGTKIFTGLGLKSGSSTDLSLDQSEVPQDQFILDIEVSMPGFVDFTPDNNTMAFNLVRDCQEEIIPFRQHFDEDNISDTNWKIINPFGDQAWKLTNTGSNGNSVGIENFKYKNAGLKDFLVSPIINLESASKASIFFDVSYSSDTLPGESLRVLSSDDNGLTYKYILYEKAGDEIAVSSTQISWTPDADSDWVNEFIDLSDFTGKKIRLAFEVTGKRSNNLFIDNIELFENDDPDPVRIESEIVMYPNPASGANFNVTFNLREKEDVTIIIFDSMGNEIFRRIYPNTLNQTFPFDLTGNSGGIFVLKAIGESVNTAKRIFVNP